MQKSHRLANGRNGTQNSNGPIIAEVGRWTWSLCPVRRVRKIYDEHGRPPKRTKHRYGSHNLAQADESAQSDMEEVEAKLIDTSFDGHEEQYQREFDIIPFHHLPPNTMIQLCRDLAVLGEQVFHQQNNDGMKESFNRVKNSIPECSLPSEISNHLEHMLDIVLDYQGNMPGPATYSQPSDDEIEFEDPDTTRDSQGQFELTRDRVVQHEEEM
ncbi:hypothetical protein VM1G_02330 [Cytospora mali]|uniref:Uncharacterized protein n=1 Tax=Cytospora mali TaxID=578113 RepID=A0A194VPP4_CYTMA|nr:hypothetical protein VM1G_02330 [Valsa mali]